MKDRCHYNLHILPRINVFFPLSPGTRRYRAGGVRVDPFQPEDQPVRDPGRPSALRGHQQPAGTDRPDRPQLRNTLEAVLHADASSGCNQNYVGNE